MIQNLKMYIDYLINPSHKFYVIFLITNVYNLIHPNAMFHKVLKVHVLILSSRCTYALLFLAYFVFPTPSIVINTCM